MVMVIVLVISVDDKDEDEDEEDDEDGDEHDDYDEVDLRTRRKMMMLRKENRPQDREAHFVRAYMKCTWTFEKSHFVEIYRKNAGP